jgi:restriction endonuclease Mrr
VTLFTSNFIQPRNHLSMLTLLSSHRRLSHANTHESQVVASLTPAELQQMPFPLFARLIADLLQSLGYEEVSFMKPMHLRGKGRNAHGGYDIRAFQSSKLSRSMVIAQLKQYRRPLPRLGVDELRGTMVRVGASHGLLITSGMVSPSAREAVQTGQHIAPVRLIDGIELASLLAEQGTARPPHRAFAPTASLPPRPSVRHCVPACDENSLSVRIDVNLVSGKSARPRW